MSIILKDLKEEMYLGGVIAVARNISDFCKKITVLSALGKDKKYENQFGQIISIIKKKNPRSRYLVNINPKNKALTKIIKKNNFKLIQHTYELIEK